VLVIVWNGGSMYINSKCNGGLTEEAAVLIAKWVGRGL